MVSVKEAHDEKRSNKSGANMVRVWQSAACGAKSEAMLLCGGGIVTLCKKLSSRCPSCFARKQKGCFELVSPLFINCSQDYR